MTEQLLSSIELETGSSADAAVIVLHGLGADGNDFVPVVGELDLPAELRVRFVFPHAPVRSVTINGGYAMRAWYDITDANLSRRADLHGVHTSQQQLTALIEQQRRRGIMASRIVLAGFSQGGAIALYTGVRHCERLAGIVALSTYLIDPAALSNEANDANRGLPVFLAHGTQDSVVRLEWAAASRKALEENGYAVEWHSYAMAHSVVGEEIQALRGFLIGVLGD